MSRGIAKWPRWVRWTLEGAVALGVVWAIQAWQARDVPAAAPAFSGPAAPEGGLSLEGWRARYPGRPVALYFWAEWCPVCSLQQDSVGRLRADWPVLTIAMQSGDAGAVARTLRARGLDWPTVVDADGSIAARYGLRGVPALVVVDAGGRIRSVAVGYSPEPALRARLWWADRFGGAD